MSRDALVLMKDPLAVVKQKVADLGVGISPATYPNSYHFFGTDEIGNQGTLFLHQYGLDDLQMIPTITQGFHENCYVYGKNVLKDEIEHYHSYYLAVFGELAHANKILCQLEDVNITINIPYIIVFDHIKEQVISSNYQFDWFSNEEKCCEALPQDWEIRQDEILSIDDYVNETRI